MSNVVRFPGMNKRQELEELKKRSTKINEFVGLYLLNQAERLGTKEANNYWEMWKDANKTKE